jgi:tetratricopeptide (TPR) repeat protein
MFNRSTSTIALMVLLLLVIGCVPVKKSLRLFERSEDTLLDEHLKKAREYEHQTDMVAALKQYELAITINPSNQDAIQGRQRAEKALRSAAKAHYKKGLEYQKEGKNDPARRQFLIALRLRPDYTEAAEMLTSRKRLKTRRFIVHEIKAGQSLSKVAKLYYGDYQKFPIIARFNNLTDATEVEIGQKVKVSEIEGIEFLIGKEYVMTEEQYLDDPRYLDWETSSRAPKKQELPAEISPAEKEKIVGQIALYRDHGAELFKSEKYPEAIVEFQKVLSVYPKDKEALDYCYRSHFHIAQNLFKQQDYLKAREQFQATLRYNNKCQECHSYIKKSEILYKDYHYKKGMKYYGNEQLVEAIEEWELVIALDPKYKRVDYLINKAHTILEKLEEIKASEQDKDPASPN